MDIDTERLNQFVGKMLGDLGGAASVPWCGSAITLGLYKALHADGPMTAGELAARTGIHERYLREWLSHQAAAIPRLRSAERKFRASAGAGDGVRRSRTALST